MLGSAPQSGPYVVVRSRLEVAGARDLNPGLTVPNGRGDVSFSIPAGPPVSSCT